MTAQRNSGGSAAMNITFEIDGALVMLPETHHVVFEPEKARKIIKSDRKVRRSHLYPLLDATAQEQAAALPADSIVVERDDGLFQIGLCDDADDPAPSLMPPEPIVPDEITGLSRARHLPKLVRQ